MTICIKYINKKNLTKAMEVPGGFNNKLFVLLSELIGTAFVMMAVNWGGVSDATPQCVGFTVMILI